MTLRKKTILAIVITFFITMVIGIGYTQTLFLKGYLNLENEAIEANVRHMHSSLDREIENLGALTNDWAAWDDTYSFMETHNQGYINSNLVDDTYNELRLNFIIYLDSNGNEIFKKAYDLEKGVEIPFDSSISSYIKTLSTNTVNKTPEFHQGIYSDNGIPVIFATSPILTSLDEGPTRGTLMFGKYLTGDLFDYLTSSVDSKVIVLPYAPEQYNRTLPSPSNPEIHIDTSQPENIHFYSLIRDTGNVPIFIIEQILPRTIFLQGLRSRQELLGALVVGSLVASIIIMLALEFGFLRRFSKLTRGINNFEAAKLNGSNMVLKGQDELSKLSVEMHNALTQLAETQNNLSSHLDFEKLLVSISTKFINLPIEKIDDGINRLLKVIGEFSQVDRSYILLLRKEDPDFIENTHEWCAAGIPSVKESRQNINLNHLRWWHKVLLKGEPVIINDVSLLPKEAKTERDILLSQSVLSQAAIPLIIGGEFIGLLGYDSARSITRWSDQTILLLEVIGTVIANAIDRNWHENKILQNQLNLANLNEITNKSIGKSTIEAACRAVSSQLHNLIGSNNSFLIYSDKNDTVKVYKSGRRLILDAKKSLHFQTVLEKAGSRVCQYETRELFTDQKLSVNNGIFGDSFLALPLIAKGAKLGVVILSFEKVRIFAPNEMAFCQQIASQVTLSILKTKALESAHQRSDELNALRATIADITSELDQSKLLHTLLERAIRLMKADGGDFCMVDEENGDLKVVAAFNMDKNYESTRIHFGEGASGRALSTKKAVIIEDYSAWPGKLNVLKESNLQSAIVVPLMIGDRVLGTLGIFHLNPEGKFSKEDQHLLSLFAQHASIAMENAMLFEKIRQMARIDEVTGLLNRRAFKEIGEYEVNRAKRLGHPVSLAMIDLDNFKHINDTFGHNAGDLALKETARIFRENIRNIDIIGRYGGDEATILMPETNKENAVLAMERLRVYLEESPIKAGNETLHITASIGVVTYLEKPPNLDEIIKQADSAMYLAKGKGKNCLRIFENTI
jgi:diguanylate cyclase (GGDEF)-like protein